MSYPVKVTLEGVKSGKLFTTRTEKYNRESHKLNVKAVLSS